MGEAWDDPHGAPIKSPSIDRVITSTVAELDELLNRDWWDLEPWLSASLAKRLLLLVKALFGSWVNLPRFDN
jgi:hypothetical protein